MLWKKNWTLSKLLNVKKIADFNEEQAEIISARIIQKLLQPSKDDDTMVDEKYRMDWKVLK
jgi:glutamyl-tRNA reductase